MARIKPQPLDTESPFGLEELFFSMTDSRGIIELGNEVFVRVSKYTKEEVEGSPHNLIRHPDMPKAIFKLLWDYIKAGKRLAAYVKNMAKDGSYYWVIATVFPIPGGYLSVRLKPSSEVHSIVKNLYAEMLRVEKAQGMEASYETLQGALKKHGFENYDSFMTSALIMELKKRGEILSRSATAAQALQASGDDRLALELAKIMENCAIIDAHFSTLFAKLDFFLTIRSQFQQKSGSILSLAKETGLLSLNAITEAARLHAAGRTLAVVAQEMKKTSDESATGIRSAEKAISELLETLDQVVFDIAASRLQAEMANFFIAELLRKAASDSNHELSSRTAELKRSVSAIVDLLSAQAEEAMTRMLEMGIGSSHLQGKIQSLHETLKTMGIIQVTGQVETARLGQDSGFRDVFDRVREFSQGAESELTTLEATISLMVEETKSIPRIRHSIRGSVRKINAALSEIGKS